MPRLKQNAKVVITLKGLGFGHYFGDRSASPIDGVWEFLFLNGVADHRFTITVKTYLKGFSQPATRTYPVSKDVQTIDISTRNAVPPAYHRHVSQDFDWRQGIDNFHDARWITDLSEELHEEPVKLTVKNIDEEKIGLTLLTVSDAIYYTYNQTDRFKVYPITKNDEPFKERVLGQVAGMDIEWQENGYTEITIGTRTPIRLENIENVLLYEVEIDNDCQSCTGTPDFHLYYEHLVDMEDKFDELRPREIKSLSVRKFLSEQLNVQDIVIVDKDNKENSLFKDFGLKDLAILAGRTDCHVATSEEIAILDFAGVWQQNLSLQNLLGVPFNGEQENPEKSQPQSVAELPQDESEQTVK